MRSDFRVVALIAAYNEADIVSQAIAHLIDQGVLVYFIDNGSTDGTSTVVERYLGKGVLGIEQFSSEGEGTSANSYPWQRILRRKEALARQLNAEWFIHHDADEFRESPWHGWNLRNAIQMVDRFGYNAVDFEVLSFHPTDNGFQPGDDVRSTLRFHEPPQPFDKLQINCWKKTDAAVDLVSDGGHSAQFAGRRVFPIRFILRHYPIRSQIHGERKVFVERRPRFVPAERARGWHVQYDTVGAGHVFIRDSSTLTEYDPEAVRLSLALRHRGVEALEADLLEAQRHATEAQDETARLREEVATKDRAIALQGQLEVDLLEAQRRTAEAGEEAARWRTDVAGLNGRAESLQRQVEVVRREWEEVKGALDATTLTLNDLRRHDRELAQTVETTDVELRGAMSRIEALLASASWRWTAPLRAAYRLITFRGR